jgi:hypothetical protein
MTLEGSGGDVKLGGELSVVRRRPSRRWKKVRVGGRGATGNNKAVWQERCLSHEWLVGEWLTGDKRRRGGCGQ